MYINYKHRKLHINEQMNKVDDTKMTAMIAVTQWNAVVVLASRACDLAFSFDVVVSLAFSIGFHCN